MIRYIARRFALTIIMLLGVTALVFGLVRMLPAPRAAGIGSQDGFIAADDAQRWQEARYGHDRPWIEQYFRWWRGMIVAEHEVLLWTDETQPRAMYRPANGDGDGIYVVRRNEVGWEQYKPNAESIDAVSAIHGDELRAFLQRLSWRDRAAIVQANQRLNASQFAQVAGDVGAMIHESDIDENERASRRIARFELTLGQSRLTNRSVADEASARLPVSMTIGVMAAAMIFIIGTLLGVLAGARVGSALERLIGGSALLAWSVPMVVSATVLFGLFGAGRPIDNNSSVSEGGAILEASAFWQWLIARVLWLALPAVVLALPGIAYVARQVRAAVAEQMQSDYVRTAFAKGCSRREVVIRHVLRPSMLVVVTLMSTMLPMIIGGSVIVESVFGIDGMGRYVYQAALNRDYDVVQAFALIAAALNMAGLLIADVLYILIDPRIRIGAAQ